MSDKIEKIVKSVCCTFVVLVLVSLALFFGRLFCDLFLFNRTFENREWSSIEISPSGLLPDSIENDPNIEKHSAVRGSIPFGRNDLLLVRLGAIDYFVQRMPDRVSVVSSRYFTKGAVDSIYFDEGRGLIVYSFVRGKYAKKTGEQLELFAGPEGISDKPSKELGRFYEPLSNFVQYPDLLFTFDRKLCRFFRMDFKERKVTKGPEMSKDKRIRPIQIGELRKGGDTDRDLFYHCWFNEPMRLKNPEGDKKDLVSIGILESPWKVQYGLVLDESGYIFLLDSRTLEIVRQAGYLPAPETFFNTGDSVRPRDLLGFTVEPVSIKPDGQYCGMAISSLSREGTSVAVAVFDKDGRLIKKENTAIAFPPSQERFGSNIYDSKMSTSEAVFWGRPWSPFVTVIRYLLENLQGPVLSAATFVTADSFEAKSGHSALFVLPNSFIGMKGRQADETLRYKILMGLALVLPSIILIIFLVKAINRDAKERGLPEKEKQWWIVGVVCLGIVGYISYRLCREEVGLVTCQNCGKGRRVDSETCHRCGNGWVVPELQEPLWRVKDS